MCVILHRTDALKRHPPFSGIEELFHLERTAERFEEKVYAAATSQVIRDRAIAPIQLFLSGFGKLKCYEI